MSTLRVKAGITSVVTLLDGRTVTITQDSAFEDDDPIIKAICKATGTAPDDWFQIDNTPGAKRARGRVEQATANPGESR